MLGTYIAPIEGVSIGPRHRKCEHGAFDARMGQVMFGPPRRPLDEIVLQMRAGGQVWLSPKVLEATQR